MTSLTGHTVSELGDLIKTKQTSPVEVLEAFLTRAEKCNAQLNAFVTFDVDRAREHASAAERDIMRGEWRGPLHGVPIAHKDNFATMGVRTTAGSKVLETNVPAANATVVRRLQDAGAIMLGKTNMHEFAFGPTNEVSFFGPVANPWDQSCISGGSSGGSGAAVAARCSPIASGSDTGGSIRMPAALCGIVGLKPTYGRISRAGIVPLSWSLDHAGPLAQSARDAALYLQATAGHDPEDAASSQHAVPADYLGGLTGRIKGLRIGVARRYYFDRSQEECVSRAEAALEVLVNLGAELIEVDVAHAEAASIATLVICLAEATSYHDDTLDDRAGLYSEQVRTYLEVGEQILAKDYLHAQRLRTLFEHGLNQVFEKVDLIATPANAMTATTIGQETVLVRGVEEPVFSTILRNTESFNLSGSPAIVTPCGFDRRGLPVGLQLVGPAFSEERLLKVVDAYQRVTDWHRQKPPI